MTGTRFASVLGLNRWSTPFQMWCEITKTYCKPFEETVYTAAGKAIEPKQIAYMREAYGMDDLRTPEDVYGKNYRETTRYDFFTDEIFGGMWDSVTVGDDGEVTGVLEFKTTKRAEDWSEDVPEYYALQAALYAYLLGCEDVIMVATFLEPEDYESPEDFEVGSGNTATFEFRLHERYPDFEEEYVEPARRWWREHVDTGDSPAYDEKADAEYLKEMRNASLNPKTDIEALVDEYEMLDSVVSSVEPQRKRMAEIEAQLKQYAKENIGDGDTATFSHGRVSCRLTRVVSKKIDKKALERAGILEKYTTEAESYRFSVNVGE